ncbi:hypothetical protein [Flavobacterium caseinilyticum]|uniref:hypothetical protein n=1 Tax=Flavobacterium caseinilyticum TaxID=2541732 RepID=UPI0014044809|nr:hypothetical protein [Flavobacterium caseinilyticum]
MIENIAYFVAALLILIILIDLYLLVRKTLVLKIKYYSELANRIKPKESENLPTSKHD